MIKNENYITIQGFMINELDLKGNDLLVYAIIYGFTQDGEHWFEGNKQYLAEWCNCSVRGVIKNLQSLIDKKLIIREEIIINNVTFSKYRANMEILEANILPREQSSHPVNKVPIPREQSSHNNIINNINIVEEEKIEKLEKSIVETLGVTNIFTINECISYLDDLPLEVIQYALETTARKNAKWNYAKTILNGYVKNNIDTLDKIKAEEIAFKGKNEDKIEDNAKAMAERLRKRMGLNNED